MAGTQTNRTAIDLPVSMAKEIIANMQEASAIMSLGRKIDLPGNGAEILVILSDPEAQWVAETGKKAVSNPNLSNKIMRAYKLAVIVPFSNEFRRDMNALYNEIVKRLPGVLAQKFDATVFGKGDKPGDAFDNFASCTSQSLASSVYDGLVAADTDVSLHGGIVNGYAVSPQMRGMLLGEKDEVGRPLFINSAAEGAVPMILGAPTHITKGAFVQGDPNTVGVVGDWTKALYGTVEGVKIGISEEATLDLGDGNVIYLFQQNMFAVRAEIEVGFRADTSAFNLLTASSVPSI